MPRRRAPIWPRRPTTLGLLTTLRRAFHTLKGSSRMVGLKDFGDAAWACEQLYNTHLADQSAAPQALLDFTGWSLGYLTDWVEDIAQQRDGGHAAVAVIDAAKRVGETPPPVPLESQPGSRRRRPRPCPTTGPTWPISMSAAPASGPPPSPDSPRRPPMPTRLRCPSNSIWSISTPAMRRRGARGAPRLAGRGAARPLRFAADRAAAAAGDDRADRPPMRSRASTRPRSRPRRRESVLSSPV